MYQNTEEVLSGQSVTVINAAEVLSIDVPGQVMIMPTGNGWTMVVQQACRVNVSFKSGTRRLEISLSPGDEIYRDHQDIIINRKTVPDTRSRYSTSAATSRVSSSVSTRTVPMRTYTSRTESEDTGYTPPDYSDLIQQVRNYVMRDVEEMIRQNEPQMDQETFLERVAPEVESQQVDESTVLEEAIRQVEEASKPPEQNQEEK